MLLTLLDHSLSFMLLVLFSFSFSYQIARLFKTCFMRVSLSLLLLLLILWLLFSPLRYMTAVNLRCKTFKILLQKSFINRSLSTFFYTRRVTLYLKVVRSLSVIWPIILLSFMLFFKRSRWHLFPRGEWY